MTSSSFQFLPLFPVFGYSFECHILSFHQVAEQVHSFPTSCSSTTVGKSSTAGRFRLLLLLCHAWFLQSACHIVLLLVVGRSVDAAACRKSNIPGSVSPACLLPVVCRGKDPVYVKPTGIPLPGVTETRRAHSYCNCRAAKVRQNYAYVEVRCHIFFVFIVILIAR